MVEWTDFMDQFILELLLANEKNVDTPYILCTCMIAVPKTYYISRLSKTHGSWNAE
jgi:hypothetical protein